MEGNISDHEYEIHKGRKLLAEVWMKWLRAADTYSVDIIPGAMIAWFSPLRSDGRRRKVTSPKAKVSLT